ncbi:hypothetical protein [Streptomyces mirabilis]|uniref:hypothetical protein n=1 Tax=Streptomyces mirabilis TaxID=68239 RepID=UPI0033FCBD68
MLEAMAALDQISDTVQRARAMTRVLDELKGLAELRGKDVVQLLARPGASLRSVGDELGLHHTTVQAIRDSHLRRRRKAAEG